MPLQPLTQRLTRRQQLRRRLRIQRRALYAGVRADRQQIEADRARGFWRGFLDYWIGRRGVRSPAPEATPAR